ncbi:hypothetical protein RRG08_001086 [Elysia crispata]|uniref:Uncharacterized protein n=1 Tax=Elysia crispata TaxID=231223 RepID=A0AAE1E5B0_9GAST|nr:hypothetical protein RRG08_001086 [Elysia crispata]
MRPGNLIIVRGCQADIISIVLLCRPFLIAAGISIHPSGPWAHAEPTYYTALRCGQVRGSPDCRARPYDGKEEKRDSERVACWVRFHTTWQRDKAAESKHYTNYIRPILGIKGTRLTPRGKRVTAKKSMKKLSERQTKQKEFDGNRLFSDLLPEAAQVSLISPNSDNRPWPYLAVTDVHIRDQTS